jgi:hypothetical protein
VRVWPFPFHSSWDPSFLNFEALYLNFEVKTCKMEIIRLPEGFVSNMQGFGHDDGGTQAHAIAITLQELIR